MGKFPIFPMYPQYSATTTAVRSNANRKFAKKMATNNTVCSTLLRRQRIHKCNGNHVKKNKKTKQKESYVLFMEYPKIFSKYPYHCHCAKTVRLLNEKFKKENTTRNVVLITFWTP